MANKKGSPQNLIPFKKGFDERRNLKGRPPIPPLNELMPEVIGKEQIVLIIKKLLAMARDGNISAIQELLNRIYGKSVQPTDITTGGDKITGIKIHWPDGTGNNGG